jgi:effector-binding domain-containing protein
MRVREMGRVRIEKRKPLTIAYVEHMGRYDQIPFGSYIDQLYGWAKRKGVRPGFYPMGIFLDPPLKTPPEKCRSEIAVAIGGEPQGDEEVKVRRIPPMTVATISHRGTTDEYKDTYDLLERWMSENGYEWAGPCMELYTKKPTVDDGKDIIYAKILAPVRKR